RATFAPRVCHKWPQDSRTGGTTTASLGESVMRTLLVAALLAAVGYYCYTFPPFATAHGGEILVRANLLNGTATAYSGGTVLVLPGIHQARIYPTRDQVYRPTASTSATGPSPFQSNEGLSIGVELTVRWAIDRARIARMSKDFPDDINADLV